MKASYSLCGRVYILLTTLVMILTISTISFGMETLHTENEQFDTVESKVYGNVKKGDIICNNLIKEIVIDVSEDGSFTSIELNGNGASLTASCPHINLVQVDYAVYVGIRNAYNNPNVCYYKMYRAPYKCTKCGTLRYIITNISVSHNYKNGKCTRCNRSYIS